MKVFFKYKTQIVFFALILTILYCRLVVGLDNKLIEYENNDIDNVLVLAIDNMKSEEYLSKFISNRIINNKFEKNVNNLKAYADIFENGNVTYLKVDNNVYELLSENKSIGTITLKETKENNILGLLKYNNYDIASVVLNEEIYNYSIYANSSYKVYVNGVLLKDDVLVSRDNYDMFDASYENVNIPLISLYKIDGLFQAPDIKIIDEFGENVTYNLQDNVINATLPKSFDKKDVLYLRYDFDPLSFAKNWSLYLSNDLNGRSGFYALLNNLQKGTVLYKRAYDWSRNYDINFTSSHTLDEPAFSEIVVNNYRYFSKNFFSVDISFNKNMILTNGDKKIDGLNETFYFLYNDGSYRLIDMRTIES